MTTKTDQVKPSLFRRISGLVLGVSAVLMFMFVIAPFFDDKPCVKPLVDFIEYRSIDASALYYTEIEEFSTSNFFMENSHDYNPGAEN